VDDIRCIFEELVLERFTETQVTFKGHWLLSAVPTCDRSRTASC